MNLNYESGKVGDYKGNPVYAIDEEKFEPKRANRNFIYALGHQGTSEILNLIFWDGSNWRELGTVNADGTDVQENRPDLRPVYIFGRTQAQKEEDWLVELKKATKVKMEEKKKIKNKKMESKPLKDFKPVKVEEVEDLTTLSAGIDAYIKEQLNRNWLGEVS